MRLRHDELVRLGHELMGGTASGQFTLPDELALVAARGVGAAVRVDPLVSSVQCPCREAGVRAAARLGDQQERGGAHRLGGDRVSRGKAGQGGMRELQTPGSAA